jgi:hypothetical protein
MPNKTIYIRDADLPVWERAQKELGESVSSVFVDCLKERLDTEAGRRKAKKSGRTDEVQAMNAVLAEINTALSLDLELHPFWSYPILDQNTINHGYKLHQKKANPDRIMSVVVWPLDFDDAGRLDAAVLRKLTAAIRKFWDGKTTDSHVFVDTTK